jgi:hypothetical protein
MTNLEHLHSTLDALGLSSNDREVFAAVMLGALSAMVDGPTWEKALATAVGYPTVQKAVAILPAPRIPVEVFRVIEEAEAKTEAISGASELIPLPTNVQPTNDIPHGDGYGSGE